MTKKEDHIIDQWKFLRNNIPYFDERFKSTTFRVIGRVAAAPIRMHNLGVREQILIIFTAKNKLSSSMKLPIIKSRLRIKLNGPPLSIFNPVPIRKLWLESGHQYAKTITNKKLVIERIRNRDKKTHTSKSFD
mgnify:CR=1 FL=1